MNGKAINIILSFVIIFNMLLFFYSIFHQMKQQEKLFLCRGHLYHWGSAFHLYFQENSNKIIDEPDVFLNKVAHYFSEKTVYHCPSKQSNSNCYSYKLNLKLYKKMKLHQNFVLPKDQVLLFDSLETSSAVSQTEEFYLEISHRHLEGANLLFQDGSVKYETLHNYYRSNIN